MRFDDGERDKEVKVRAEVVGPEDLPECERRVKREFALEAAEDPAEAEEEVERAGSLCEARRSAVFAVEREGERTEMLVQLWIHERQERL